MEIIEKLFSSTDFINILKESTWNMYVLESSANYVRKQKRFSIIQGMTVHLIHWFI